MSFSARHIATGALLALALTAPPVMAMSSFAGTIRGRVTDKESGQPIVAAQIVVVGAAQRYGAISDNNGNYVLRGAPAGRAVVRATRIGFLPLEEAVAIPADGDVT